MPWDKHLSCCWAPQGSKQTHLLAAGTLACWAITFAYQVCWCEGSRDQREVWPDNMQRKIQREAEYFSLHKIWLEKTCLEHTGPTWHPKQWTQGSHLWQLQQYYCCMEEEISGSSRVIPVGGEQEVWGSTAGPKTAVAAEHCSALQGFLHKEADEERARLTPGICSHPLPFLNNSPPSSGPRICECPFSLFRQRFQTYMKTWSRAPASLKNHL